MDVRTKQGALLLNAIHSNERNPGQGGLGRETRHRILHSDSRATTCFCCFVNRDNIIIMGQIPDNIGKYRPTSVTSNDTHVLMNNTERGIISRGYAKGNSIEIE